MNEDDTPKIISGFGKRNRRYLVEVDGVWRGKLNVHDESVEEDVEAITPEDILTELSNAAGLVLKGISKEVTITLKAATIKRPYLITKRWVTKSEKYWHKDA